MARLSPVTYNELVRRLRELEFEGPFAGGKHPQMRRGNRTFSKPNNSLQPTRLKSVKISPIFV